MNIKKLTILAVAATIAALISLRPGPALATHVSCGDTITTDTTLDADLACVGTPGLIIGADNITLNLNGHTISGTAAAKAHGIRNGDLGTSPSFDKVTIKGGTVIGFEQGIRAEGSPAGTEINRFTIKDMNITGQTSSSAIDVLDAKDVEIKDVTIFIAVVSTGIEAIRLESVDGVKVKNVHVDGGNVGVNFGCAPCPDPNGPTNGEIKDSTFANNGNGIILFDTTDAKVEKNVVTGSGGSGIIVGLGFVGGFGPVTNVKLSKNTVVGSGSNGILLGAADSSEVSKNTVTGNTGNGISLIGSIGNEIEKNTASSNGGDGIDLNSTSTGNVLEKNTANGNGDFGYDDATAGGGTLGTANTYEDNRCTLNTTAGSDPSGLCVPQP